MYVCEYLLIYVLIEVTQEDTFSAVDVVGRSGKYFTSLVWISQYGVSARVRTLTFFVV